MNTLVSAVALALAFADGAAQAPQDPKPQDCVEQARAFAAKRQRESQPLIGYDDANEEKLAGFIESLLRNTRQP